MMNDMRRIFGVLLLMGACAAMPAGASESAAFKAAFAEAEAVFKDRDFARAVSLYQQALDVAEPGPDQASAHYGKGLSHLRLREYDPAIEQFEAAIAVEPNSRAWEHHPMAMIQIGLAHKHQKAYEEAIEAFRRVEHVRTNGVYKTRALMEIASCLEASADQPGVSAEERAALQKQTHDAYVETVQKGAADGLVLYLTRAYEKIDPARFESPEAYRTWADQVVEDLLRNRRFDMDKEADAAFLEQLLSDAEKQKTAPGSDGSAETDANDADAAQPAPEPE